MSRRFDFIDPNRIMSLRIKPQVWVSPHVCEFDLNQMAAAGAPWPSGLEDCVGALAVAVHTLQHKVSALISGNPRWAARFAEGFHSPRPKISVGG